MKRSFRSDALQELVTIMKQLRDKETGCAWDKVQTFESLIPTLLEETYEVQDAVMHNHPNDLLEELGDLLYHVIFYAEIASEQNRFDFETLCRSTSQKLIRRHPEVFSNENTFQMKQNWEQQKQLEREAKSYGSLLDDLPNTLPAVMRAQKIQKRCAAAGFDWTSEHAVLAKVEEEITEVRNELDKRSRNRDALQEEIGDLLFSVVNLTRYVGYNAEQMLYKANAKFERRFRAIEKQLISQNRTLAETRFEELKRLWEENKFNEKVKEADK